ncbi:hypothetical protein BDV96DRAFT_581664 [Lophiotrema nucula]|uniref:Uncharacterized protein n=1 Tax=Lophiotrema nucula TaxID=690887 RepID=A0A6A5YY33_9PLEO|nr:hypothetical protein BDV96DRAFT_581664 [Lophiotrema nucula]
MVGVIDYIEALGLRTYGKELEDPKVLVRRPVFKHEDVLRLYRKEIPALFGQLLRDERDGGHTLNRDDPNLFDRELEVLLTELGPRIWPEPGKGDRSHLREPKRDSMYEMELSYPRDKSVLKGYIRNIILSKSSRSDINIEALINKEGERHSKPKTAKSTPINRKMTDRHIPDKGIKGSRSVPPPKTKPARPSGRKRGLSEITKSNNNDNPGSESDDDAEDAEGAPTSRRVSRRHTKPVVSSESASEYESAASRASLEKLKGGRKSTSKGPPPTPRRLSIKDTKAALSKEARPFRMELRLYRASSLAFGQVSDKATILLEKDCTSEECFSTACELLKSDISWMIFHLPEDMSLDPRIKIDRGKTLSEQDFQVLMAVFRDAPRYPGDAPRACEVQCGLDFKTQTP